jgi:hypothetical protein
VTVAYSLQLALVGTLLLLVGVTIADAVHYDGLIDQAVRVAGPSGGDAAMERGTNLSDALVTGLVALLFAAWLGIAAIWLRRGRNVARILSLVGLGAPLVLSALMCVVSALFGSLIFGFMSAMPDEGFTDGEGFTGDEGFAEWDGSDFYQELDRLDGKGWSIAFDVVSAAAVVTVILLGIAILVLLLTGSSHRYFCPPRQAPRTPYQPYLHPAQFHGYPPACPYPPAHGPPVWYPGTAPPPYPAQQVWQAPPPYPTPQTWQAPAPPTAPEAEPEQPPQANG